MKIEESKLKELGFKKDGLRYYLKIGHFLIEHWYDADGNDADWFLFAHDSGDKITIQSLSDLETLIRILS